MIKKFLTSNYDKSPTSNISKLNKIFSDEIRELQDTFKHIEKSNDIDLAKGKMLDDIGANFQQYRGETTDEVYRALIKSKIARGRSDGTLNNLLDVLELALGVDKNTIGLKEGTHPLYASIEIDKVPIDTLARIGMTTAQLGRIVNTMVAAGVKLESIVFEGTFEYVQEPESSIELGYSDVDMTNGGTLGDIYTPSQEDVFPL